MAEKATKCIGDVVVATSPVTGDQSVRPVGAKIVVDSGHLDKKKCTHKQTDTPTIKSVQNVKRKYKVVRFSDVVSTHLISPRKIRRSRLNRFFTKWFFGMVFQK